MSNKKSKGNAAEEALKELERIVIRALVSSAKSKISSRGSSLASSLETDTTKIQKYPTTYQKNITDGLQGQAAQAASSFLSSLSTPTLTNPVK